MHQLNTSKRMVIKIGSALLVDETNAVINHNWLVGLIDEIAELVSQGVKIILVSSGAIALGKLTLHLKHKHLLLDKKQAAAATGQIQLMQLYQSLLQAKDLQAAQVLLTLGDTENRRHYINLRNTLLQLLQLRVIPIINENDSVATDELCYGDNDRLAARVAQMVEADTLVLLSDIDGLYDADPHSHEHARLIPEVKTVNKDIIAIAKDSHSNYGSGGMVTKLAAAKIAMRSGCHMLITNGKVQHPLKRFIDSNVGTWFVPKISPQRARKNWLCSHLQMAGTITVDAGAAAALRQGASLLPVGIVNVQQDFLKGVAVEVVHGDNKVIARGLSNYSCSELVKIIGKNSAEIETSLGYRGCDEVIHRDNLVFLQDI